ncbi:hypothetical protein GDO86_011283 [Hymenochirus boettgeri]|uniref:G-protein coupled receptors family 1 profile domain-containing protein n=1 Tax=Hymenochirus boettgeri TaxID=247094 RepID=A0A8T2JB53_9PIPI|nr:hypothetical protein GDO86_011283 [Hymenochirus boettgeri]
MEGLNGTAASVLSSGASYTVPLTFFSLIICVFGLVGNGILLCLLFFKVKKNQFTFYVLNLSIADFTFLFGLSVWFIYLVCIFYGMSNSNHVTNLLACFCSLLYHFGFNSGIYLLTVIGLERCFAVLYPLWYQCKRPNNLGVYVCIAMWMLSILVTGLDEFVCGNGKQYLLPGSEDCTNINFFTSALYVCVVCIMLLSSVTLLYDIQKAPLRCHSPRLYIVIIASMTVFLLSVVPARILGLLIYFNILKSEKYVFSTFFITSISSALNCSANPYIYTIAARWGKNLCQGSSMKNALENMFKEAT